jgi:[acyl-carrier-protein] S-malonyltransferase
MDAACPEPGGMLGLRGLTPERIEALASRSGCRVAIVNGPGHVVLGGALAALAEAERLAAEAGATTIQRLPVAVPAHTRLLAGAVAPFAAALREARPRAAAVAVLSGLDGSPVRGGDAAVEALSRQVAERLEWERCLAVAGELGCSVLVELGPGTALARMAREALPGVAVRAASEFRSAAGLARWVADRLAA